MNAPTGRKISVSVSENATCAWDLPNSLALAVRHITTRKKSNASSVQPRNPAVTAARWSERGVGAGAAVMARPNIRDISRPARPDTDDARAGAGAHERSGRRPAGPGAAARPPRLLLRGGTHTPRLAPPPQVPPPPAAVLRVGPPTA